jgi:hypothetical protein
MLRILDGQYRGTDGTLDYAGSPKAIATKQAAVASRTFVEKQVAVSCASAVNRLQHNGFIPPMEELIGQNRADVRAPPWPVIIERTVGQRGRQSHLWIGENDGHLEVTQYGLSCVDLRQDDLKVTG